MDGADHLAVPEDSAHRNQATRKVRLHEPDAPGEIADRQAQFGRRLDPTGGCVTKRATDEHLRAQRLDDGRERDLPSVNLRWSNDRGRRRYESRGRGMLREGALVGCSPNDVRVAHAEDHRIGERSDVVRQCEQRDLGAREHNRGAESCRLPSQIRREAVLITPRVTRGDCPHHRARTRGVSVRMLRCCPHCVSSRAKRPNGGQRPHALAVGHDHTQTLSRELRPRLAARGHRDSCSAAALYPR